MRITHIIQLWPPMGGGTERQAELLAGEQAALGIEIEVLTTGKPRPDDPPWLSRRAPAGSRARYAFALHRAILGGEGVVHAHLVSSHTLAASFAVRRSRRPLIIKIGASGPDGDIGTSLAKRGGRWKLSRCFGAASMIVAPSASSAGELLDYGIPSSRIVVIPNGIDLSRFGPDPEGRAETRKRLGIEEGEKMALFAGRLVPQKGIALIEEYLESRRTGEPVIVVAGDGPERSRLERLKGKGLILTGYLDDPRPLYAAADLFILPSRSEGLSNALIEAMASGLLPVASDIGPNADLIEDGITGFLFRSGSADSMRESIKRAMEAAPSMAEAAAKKAGKYDIKGVAREYSALYEEVLS